MYQVQFDPLANGAMLIYVPMPNRRQVVISAGIRTGSADDPIDQLGLDHLLEHLRLRAAGPFSTQRAMARQIDGSCNDANGETDPTTTVLTIETIDRYLLPASQVMGCMVIDPTINQANDDPERERIKEEIRESLDLPDDWLNELFDGLMFPGFHVSRSVTGDLRSVEKLSLEALRQLHQQQIVGSRLVVVVAGGFEPDDIAPQLHRLYSHLPSGERPLRQRIDFTTLAGRRHIENRELEHVHFVMGFPTFDFTDPDAHILGAIRNYLSGRTSSLLRVLIDAIGKIYTLSDYYWCWDSVGQINWRGSTDRSKFEAVIETVVAECFRLRSELISADDLDLIKRNMEIRAVYRFDDPLQTATFLAREYLNRGSCLLFPEYLQRLQALTVEDMRRVANRIFVPERLSLAAAGPLQGVTLLMIEDVLRLPPSNDA